MACLEGNFVKYRNHNKWNGVLLTNILDFFTISVTFKNHYSTLNNIRLSIKDYSSEHFNTYFCNI